MNLKKSKKLHKFIKKNRLFLIVVGGIIILEFFLILFFGGGITSINRYFDKNSDSSNGMILFEGEDCFSCIKVDNFIKANDIESKILFTRLEVFHNLHNADVLADKAQICGVNSSQLGVPLLWDGQNCIIGYVDIIEFFKNAIASSP